MPDDPQMLIGFAVAAIVVVWLVLSVLRRLFGLALLAAIILAAAILWFNPGLAAQLWSQLQMLAGGR